MYYPEDDTESVGSSFTATKPLKKKPKRYPFILWRGEIIENDYGCPKRQLALFKKRGFGPRDLQGPRRSKRIAKLRADQDHERLFDFLKCKETI